MFHTIYRPKDFDEFIGNKEIIKSIKSLLNQKDIPHSFLFVGESGIGKTSLARILSNKIGGPNNEIIEINVANTNGVDYFRQLNESSNYSSLFGGNKIYILDEIHQMTRESQNMLLKLLEQPPKHVYFCLCTTETGKLLPTLRNRCTSYTLKPLSDTEIKQLIQKVTVAEKIDLSDDILDLIIYKAEGIPRSCLVYLNQVKDINSFDEATKLLANEIIEEEDVINLCRLLIAKSQWHEIVELFNKITIDPEQIRIVITGYLAGCLKKKCSPKYAEMLSLFLSPLTFGSQKSELIFLLYKAWGLC